MGAALGCYLVVPLIPAVGPGGLLFVTAAVAVGAAALLVRRRAVVVVAIAVALGLVAVPVARMPAYYEFKSHISKRWVSTGQNLGRREVVRWDPISKIEVQDLSSPGGRGVRALRQKHVAYDGGNQSSLVFPFDGDFEKVWNDLGAGRTTVEEHFWFRAVLAANYLKRGSGHEALVIGCAGGQEIKAALLMGARHVDVVEMVGAVVELAQTWYNDYHGNLFNNPAVTPFVAEGRSFLRSTDKKYDVIQIFSTQTSSSVADGMGAMAPVFLQTAEAYQEYFEHLTDDGVLQMNYQTWPRMITTAALAWKHMGRTDFQRHVVVERKIPMDTLPTLLVKMSPWTDEDLNRLAELYARPSRGEAEVHLAVNPLAPPESAFLPPAFFTGDLPAEIRERAGFRVDPATDDQPYFKFIRKSMEPIEADPARFVNPSTAAILNSQIARGGVPEDVMHLVLTGAASILAGLVCMLVPPLLAPAARQGWRGRGSTLVYFAYLGLGFILIELVLIQIFMVFVGFPIYTYATVLAALLASAGLGSHASERLGITPERRWWWPFLGILVLGGLLLVLHSTVFAPLMALPTAGRVAASVLMIAPLGFVLGMPFPLGVTALRAQPEGAIAWGWSLNGLFSVIGAVASVVLAIAAGFSVTFGVGLLVYVVAWPAFGRLRDHVST